MKHMWSPVTDLDVPSSGHLPTNSSPPVSPCDPSSAETFYKQLIAEDTQGHSADGKPLCLEGTVDAPWCSSWILNVAIWHDEKKKQPSTGNHRDTYLAYPRNPQLQCCDRKCRASSTEMAVFFWRPPDTKFRRQHWIGGRGGHDLCGVVLHRMAVFFLKNPLWWNKRWDTFFFLM